MRADSYLPEPQIHPHHRDRNLGTWLARGKNLAPVQLLICALAQLFTCPAHAQNSVLSTGSWYKIGVVQRGIHKLNAADLQRAGLNVSGIDPRHIRLFGNGGAMLPQANAAPRPDDLVENSILVEGETDGRFDASDYVLFYAQNPHVIRYDSAAKRFSHQTNLYTDTAYYFLTVSELPGRRIQNQPSPTAAAREIRTFDDYVFHEKELINILQSGREWYGEKFEAVTERTVSLDVPGITGLPARVGVSVMAQSPGSSSFNVKISGQSVGSVQLAAISAGTYDLKGTADTKNFGFTPGGSPLVVSVAHQRGGGIGYLNWLGVQCVRELKLYGSQTVFRSFESFAPGNVRYAVRDAGNDSRVWDISNILFPANQKYKVQGSELVFEAEGGKWREFVVFRPQAELLQPAVIRRVADQNLHGMDAPQLLIVTHPLFLPQAQRLADLRRTHDGLRVEIATTDQIYNEFASGKPDITAIRDFIRFLYRKSNSLQYVTLFGDASYDYKNRLSNTNFVPVYESYQSLHPIFSHSSDDYFGFMDENEGEWTESSAGDHTQEIAIGRLPVKTPQEADHAVDKLIRYAQNPETLGDWRQRITFVADDGDGNTHQSDADQLANGVENTHETYLTRKIFLDAFPQVSFANGQKSPGAEKAITEAVERGSLILNYTGHGSEIGWAQEQMLTVDLLGRWRNPHRLPLMVTATCEFGRYDDPESVSGAEVAFLKPNGGAIALLTTTRPVFSSSNFAVNTAFYNAVFKPINGEMPRLGDVMKATKNNSLSGSINRNFALLGDASMRLAYPGLQATITKINGKDIENQQDTLKALDLVTLEGEIRGATGTPSADFEGTLQATVFDKPGRRTTLGTESARMVFSDQNSIFFRGQTPVRNGRFRVSFVVPKDIDYTVGTGRMSLYAQRTDAGQDAAGYRKILVGGTNPAAIAENQPPRIRLFMNDTTFANGGETGPSPLLLAQLTDDNGINISQTGIGHELKAVLDDSVEIVLNDYFTALAGTCQRGEVRYPLQNLTPGKHRLTLTVWDTHNNAATAALDFTVVAEGFRIWNLGNHPNPVGAATSFRFGHNRPGEDLNVEIKIYQSNGQLIHTLGKNITASPPQVDGILWETDNKLPAGIYFYQITVRCMSASATEARKMVVLR